MFQTTPILDYDPAAAQTLQSWSRSSTLFRHITSFTLEFGAPIEALKYLLFPFLRHLSVIFSGKTTDFGAIEPFLSNHGSALSSFHLNTKFMRTEKLSELLVKCTNLETLVLNPSDLFELSATIQFPSVRHLGIERCDMFSLYHLNQGVENVFQYRLLPGLEQIRIYQSGDIESQASQVKRRCVDEAVPLYFG